MPLGTEIDADEVDAEADEEDADGANWQFVFSGAGEMSM